MVIFGGLGRFPGAAIGAFIITILYEIMRPLVSYRLIFFGALVMFTMIFIPNGLIGAPEYFQKIKSWKFSRPESR